LFSFFISIIPSLMPVVGLRELHLQASELGYLFTAMAVGSVISGSFIIPWARARYSPQRITTFANLLLLLTNCLMVLVHRPFVFLVVSALGGMGWTLSASELWVASQLGQRAHERDNDHGRTGATALGGIIWGVTANYFGVVPTFLGAAVFGLAIMIIVRVVPALQISIDFTKGLSFESAPVSIFSHRFDPGRLPAPKDGPVSITGEFKRRHPMGQRKEADGTQRGYQSRSDRMTRSCNAVAV
jgi:hypothetical protein